MSEEQTQYEVKKFTENAIMLAMQLLEFAGCLHKMAYVKGGNL